MNDTACLLHILFNVNVHCLVDYILFSSLDTSIDSIVEWHATC